MRISNYPIARFNPPKRFGRRFSDTFQYFKENVKITMIKNDVKYVDFFIFRCKARVGNCTLVSVWHPFENYYWICPTSPHHKYISNIFHPQMIEDQNYLELKSRVLCKNWTNCFRAKRFRLFFFFTKISPARSSKEMSNTLWSLRLQTLITSTFVSNKFCLDICSLHKHNHTMDPKIWNCKARDFTILSGYLQFAYN